MSTPKQIIRGLHALFPNADFSRDVIVSVNRGVAAIVKTPRPLQEGELEAAIAALSETSGNPVPRAVTPLQMRKALRAAGLKPIIDAAMTKAPDEVREEWEYATVVLRDNATLEALAKSIGKTDEELDELFRLAATF